MKMHIVLVAVTWTTVLGRQIISKGSQYIQRDWTELFYHETVKQNITLFLNSVSNTMVYVIK